MIKNEEQIGEFDLEKDYIYPRYYVAKFKTQKDVLIKTSSRTMEDCCEKAKEIFKTTPYLLDELVYILIELRNVE